jgi:E3 ubiquitin-protein ligase UBR4
MIRCLCLRCVLRILTGLARGHEATQVLLSKECVPGIHRLEHVSTPLSVLAENLMEVMKENKAVKERIEQIRDQTKAEKKRLAMVSQTYKLTD